MSKNSLSRMAAAFGVATSLTVSPATLQAQTAQTDVEYDYSGPGGCDPKTGELIGGQWAVKPTPASRFPDFDITFVQGIGAMVTFDERVSPTPEQKKTAAGITGKIVGGARDQCRKLYAPRPPSQGPRP